MTTPKTAEEKGLTVEGIADRCPHLKEIGRLLVRLQQKEIALPDAAILVGYQIEQIQSNAIAHGRELERKRVKYLAEQIWETRWQSEDADYQRLVGTAAEIRSGNYENIDSAIATKKEGE